jgi:Zn-dependent oligopeptidase
MSTTFNLIDFSQITVDLLNNIYNDYTNAELEYNNMLVNLKQSELTFNTVITMRTIISEAYVYKLALFNMEQFHTDKTIRDKCHELNVKMGEFNIAQSMRTNVYKQIKYYYDNVYQNEKPNLNQQQIRFVEKMMLEYKYIGMDLEDKDRQKVEEINKKISRLSNEFSHNVSSDNTNLEFVEDELSGMSKEWLESRLNLDKTKDGRNIYKISLKYPDYVPIMEQCSNRNTRRLMATAYLSRCMDSNTNIASEILKLKNTKANLMGFEFYSDYKLQKQMAKTTQNVMKFLNSLKEKIQPMVKSDLDLIRKEAILDNIHDIQLWDISYYTKKIKEREANIDMEALKKHFPLSTVTKGMFEIYQTLFDYNFVDISDTNKETFWHPDVKLFKVIDNSSKTTVGYFYLDLFPREGKYSHAAVFPIIRKSSIILPVCIMACNFDPKSNLRFEEIKTFFHEFGHIMHNMAAVSEYGSLAGTTCERDFVEAPSQMLEEWCYVEKAINKMTPDDNPIPAETLENLQLYRKQFVGYHNARQIVFGLTDMALHGSLFDQPTDEVYNTIFEDIIGLKPIPKTNMIASFGHIFGGYDAGYYGYLWSEVYAKDMFYSKFAGKELDPNIGIKYKTKLLQWGSIRDSMESLIDFLGDEPSNAAFLNSLSLS